MERACGSYRLCVNNIIEGFNHNNETIGVMMVTTVRFIGLEVRITTKVIVHLFIVLHTLLLYFVGEGSSGQVQKLRQNQTFSRKVHPWIDCEYKCENL